MEEKTADWHDIKMEEIFPEEITGTNQEQSIPVAPPRNKMKFKKNAAPLPPGSPRKFGNYKPKIYDDSININSVNKTEANTNHGYVMIGDKHKPLIISSANAEEKGDRISNNNFRKNEVFNEVPESIARGFDAQEGIFNYGEVVSNPLYGDVSAPIAPPRRKRELKDLDGKSPVPMPRRHKYDQISEGVKSLSNKKDDQDYPYIPAPDYDLDDSEATLTLHEDQDAPYKSKYLKRNNNIYKEFDGEDFGQYLSDDEDYEFDTASNISYTWRKDVRYKKQYPPQKVQSPKRTLQGGKALKDAKVVKSSGKALRPTEKSKSKVSGRNTIREFSFAHSKLAGADRTVKSTSALGRQVKCKERPRINTSRGNDTAVSESYEDFLRMRHGDNGSLKSNSSDSGLEMMDDAMRYKMFQRNQPRELRKHGDNDRKNSLWQKLTWRFRKNVGVYEMGES